MHKRHHWLLWVLPLLVLAGRSPLNFNTENKTIDELDELSFDEDDSIHSNVSFYRYEHLPISTPNRESRLEDYSEGSAARSNDPKDGRLMPYFLFAKYMGHAPCRATTGMMGTCYHKKHCALLRGLVYGRCYGFGVCCVVRRSCGQIATVDRTHFTNPGYPASTSASQTCTLTFTRPLKRPVCQIRLDFVEFQTNLPVNGDCISDRFHVHGQELNVVVPPLCGLNTGQHIYFDLPPGKTPFTLTVATSGPGERRWNIAANLIECNNPNRAPKNCLQFYTGGTGLFTSFNYHLTVPPSAGGGYLNNMDYTACFRKEAGFCSQQYVVNSTITPFELFNLNSNNAPTLGPGQSGIGVTECASDYVLLGDIRFCGTRLNPSLSPQNPTTDAPVTDTSMGPIFAHVVSNEVANGVGFQMMFSQIPCSMPGQAPGQGKR